MYVGTLLSWHIIYNFYFLDNDVCFGAIVFIGLDSCDFIYNFHSFNNFTEYSIFPVKIRCSSVRKINLTLLLREFQF